MRRCMMLMAVVMLIMVSLPERPASANELCFPEQPDITACLDTAFAPYWTQNGGLAVLGYPITTAQAERNPDLNTDLLTQWTERTRLEYHPLNPEPYRILLGRMGAERLLQLGRDPLQTERDAGPVPGCLWFEETGLNVCDQAAGLGFKTYWESNGLNIEGLDAYNRSLQLFGLPLTAPQMETNASGDTVLTQWFERARFEWHPDNPDQFKVLLGLLGVEVHGDRPPGDQPAASMPEISLFGVEINRGFVGRTAPRLRPANIGWVRYGSILWNEVEAEPGVRDWSRLNEIESELRLLAEAGVTTMVTVKGTPAWAQKVPGAICGPIETAALDQFADFVRELVLRYSRPPYNVRYWEFGNEPDVDPSLVAGDSIFGCWGDQDDPYYGGGHYAEMLKRVYPAVKQANPMAQVVVGGLLLDCDPSAPPAGKDCKPALFLEGILQNGGGQAFDLLAYHAYSYWSAGNVDWDSLHPNWRHRGGALLGKLDFLRSVLDRYGLSKPIVMNEGGLLCYPTGVPCAESDPNFYRHQANYAVRLYLRSWANGITGVAWYTLNGPGWREGGLLDAGQNPRPAYEALQFMAHRFSGASYAGPLSTGILEGYAFQLNDRTYQVYWTNDGSSVSLPLPEGTRAIYNQIGQSIDIPAGEIMVGFEPIILEIGS